MMMGSFLSPHSGSAGAVPSVGGAIVCYDLNRQVLYLAVFRLCLEFSTAAAGLAIAASTAFPALRLLAD
jgi:hypothetical protein